MTLNPGPKRDALVAEALGWKREVYPECPYPKEAWIPTGAPIKQASGSLLLSYWTLPPFSTDLSKAVEALEEFCEKNDYDADITCKVRLKRAKCYIYDTPEKARRLITLIESELGFALVICVAIIEAAKEKP